MTYRVYGPVVARDQPAASTPSGGTITIRSIQFESWDPHFSDFTQDISHFFMVWRGLYHMNKDGRPQPAMADGPPNISADGRTYTVKIKAGLQWSDGQPLDANDFVLGIQRTCNPDNRSHYQYVLTAIVGCDAYYGAIQKASEEKLVLQKAVGARAIDATTLEVKLISPQPTFATLLAMWPTFPAPKHKLATVDATWPAPMENVYNGPFRPSKYAPNDKLELVPNDHYSGGQKAQAEKLIIRYVSDSAIALNAYSAGVFDATQISATQLALVRSDPVLSAGLTSYSVARTTGIQPNLKDPTLAKLEVRLALSQATDRNKLNDQILNGAHTVSTNWMPPARSGASPNQFDGAIGFDTAKAKENLKEAGYDNGSGFPVLTLLQTDTATARAIGDFLQSEWKKHLNIDLILEYTDSLTRSVRFNSGEFQIVLGGWGEDYADPENWIVGLFETGGAINKQSCSMPEIDALIAEAKFNQNDEERRQQYRDIERLIVENVCGIAPLYHNGFHAVVKPYITGMVENQKPDDKQLPGEASVEFWSTTNADLPRRPS